jgi:dsDNA-specific endonuclease/ATPase MutS2
MPAPVIEAARGNLSEPHKQLADHLARMDDDLRKLELERQQVTRDHMGVAERERKLRSREQALAEREERLKKRLDAKVDDQLREARREIDAVINGLKTRAAELSERAAVRLNAGGRVRAAGVSTGDLGDIRSEARDALDQIGQRVLGTDEPVEAFPAPAAPAGEIEPGSRVTVGALGLEGVVLELRGKYAEVEVRGKRLQSPLRDLKLVARSTGAVRVHVDLQPREGSLNELNVIGDTVRRGSPQATSTHRAVRNGAGEPGGRRRHDRVLERLAWRFSRSNSSTT